ncbi:MAG: 2-C-methyl-D-erythritol 2,4-cyclodiphosphate synthase [Roseibium sp.]|nr:2-C-methyl-D-erythritol 2,4-cyclodiphosphate synthase [Roseibium sp.]
MTDNPAAPAPAPLAELPDVRVGNGYDVHAFGPGDTVVLGGVSIPHERSLKGHSDADVVLHAITDAILGALADGDIGSHFPPTDPAWQGAASDQFLQHAILKVAQRGGRVAHIDVTVVCEAPKIGPHRDRMRQAIADICQLPTGRVSVKATTSERLGFTGRKEGIASLATATLRLPFDAEEEKNQ